MSLKKKDASKFSEPCAAEGLCHGVDARIMLLHCFLNKFTLELKAVSMGAVAYI